MAAPHNSSAEDSLSSAGGSKAKPLRYIGFWCDARKAEANGWPDPQSWVDANWDPAEREKVVRYLKAGRPHEDWQGYSWCRFHCGIPDDEMGASDLTDGVYVWPEGFAHYLEHHQVKPPEDFLAHVREQLRRGPTDNRQ